MLHTSRNRHLDGSGSKLLPRCKGRLRRRRGRAARISAGAMCRSVPTRLQPTHSRKAWPLPLTDGGRTTWHHVKFYAIRSVGGQRACSGSYAARAPPYSLAVSTHYTLRASAPLLQHGVYAAPSRAARASALSDDARRAISL